MMLFADFRGRCSIAGSFILGLGAGEFNPLFALHLEKKSNIEMYTCVVLKTTLLQILSFHYTQSVFTISDVFTKLSYCGS